MLNDTTISCHLTILVLLLYRFCFYVDSPSVAIVFIPANTSSPQGGCYSARSIINNCSKNHCIERRMKSLQTLSARLSRTFRERTRVVAFPPLFAVDVPKVEDTTLAMFTNLVISWNESQPVTWDRQIVLWMKNWEIKLDESKSIRIVSTLMSSRICLSALTLNRFRRPRRLWSCNSSENGLMPEFASFIGY